MLVIIVSCCVVYLYWGCCRCYDLSCCCFIVLEFGWLLCLLLQFGFLFGVLLFSCFAGSCMLLAVVLIVMVRVVLVICGLFCGLYWCWCL